MTIVETLQAKIDAKLLEQEAFINGSEFTVERNTVFVNEVRTLEAQRDAAKAIEARKAAESQVANTSHRGAPGNVASAAAQVAPDAEKASRAFELFLREGRSAVLANNELRTYAPLDSTNNANGAVLVPTLIGPEIDKKLKSSGAILTVLRHLNASNGDVITWPTSDDTAEKGEFIAQNGAVSQSNPVFGVASINAFQWSSKQVLVPNSLIQDSAFDLVGHLTDCFGLRAARGFSDRVVNDATDGLLTAGVVSGSLTAASPTALNYFEPLTLQGKVDMGYAANGTYAMTFATYLGYRALVSTTGQALWNPLEANAGILHGKPFVICNDMPSFGTTTNKYVLFGDFSKVIFRTAGPMSVFRFNELFMSNLQQGFQAYQRIASKCVQASALAILKAA